MSEPDRAEIAARHRIPKAADDLVGTTATELEADAAEKAALVQALAPKAEEAEPVGTEPPADEVEVPTDKPTSEFTDAEREAWLKRVDETVMRSLGRRDRARAEEVERREREAALTDDQLIGFALTEDASSKRSAEVQFLASLHGIEGES